MRGSRRTARLVWQSVALVVLLASTWLVVGVSLQGASTAVVSAGRTAFTVLGLLALTAFPAQRPPADTAPEASPYRWWQTAVLALSGVTAYTVLSTAAIALAGPALPALALTLVPAVVLVAESVLARTRPPLLTMAATAVAVTGAVLFALPRLAGSFDGTGGSVGWGALAAVGALLSQAFYGLYFARTNRTYRGPMAPRILPIFAAGTIPLAAWAAADLARHGGLSWSTAGMLALLGIVIYVPAYLLQHRILADAGASYAALLGLGVAPLVGLASALLHLAGAPVPLQLAGLALTLAGMVAVIRGRAAAHSR